MTISHVLFSPYLLPTFTPPIHFLIFLSTPIDILYKCGLWLYIAFGSAKKWLT